VSGRAHSVHVTLARHQFWSSDVNSGWCVNSQLHPIPGNSNHRDAYVQARDDNLLMRLARKDQHNSTPFGEPGFDEKVVGYTLQVAC